MSQYLVKFLTRQMLLTGVSRVVIQRSNSTCIVANIMYNMATFWQWGTVVNKHLWLKHWLHYSAGWHVLIFQCISLNPSWTTLCSFQFLDLNQNDSYLTFSDLFDIQHLNRLSESSIYAINKGEFFSHTPRNVIFVKPGPMNSPTGVVREADYECDGYHNCY